MKTFFLKSDVGQKSTKEYQINYAEILNEAQYKAVMAQNGAFLVIAGAGTGKTRTLIYRLARLIEDGVHPQSILLLTFTRRAAKEMLDRASTVLDDRCKRVRGGTFHQYCAQILREFGGEMGVNPTFTILDSSDTQEVLQHVRQPYKEKNKGQRFPEKSTLYAIISTSFNKQIPISSVLQLSYPQFLHFAEDLEKLKADFINYKESQNMLDFDDLLVLTKELLETKEAVRVQVGLKNKYVMIDEYQDINKLQADLIKLFSSVSGNVMAVGDDAQSIYAFRGADHNNILRFPEDFGAKEVIKLEQNFRSTQQILDLANNLLNQAVNKYDKQLFTLREAGELPGLIKTSTENEQSDFIAQYVLHLREQGIPLNDVSVLFRNSRDSYDLEVELARRGIPYVKYGGQKISEAAHIKDVLAHIRVVVNPGDVISWSRILTLIEGIGPKTASELMMWMRGARDGVSPSKNYLHKVSELSELLAFIKEKSLDVSACIEAIKNYYDPICKKKYDDFPKRIKDLEAFVTIARPFLNIAQLLEDLTLDPIDGTAVDTEKSQNEESPLVLSTIHSAKGLEWNTVFIIQCVDGIIPSGYSVDSEEALEEELRLLYVAATRAKDQLLFTYPIVKENAFGDYFSNPSRFIQQVSSNLLEPWNLLRDSLPEESNQNLLTD
jgi:DNA helicase II / ATP-dependent DNA helicase PcrA